jgi:hypothetical protein
MKIMKKRNKNRNLSIIMYNYKKLWNSFEQILRYNKMNKKVNKSLMLVCGGGGKIENKIISGAMHMRFYYRLFYFRVYYHKWWNKCALMINEECSEEHNYRRRMFPVVVSWHR